MANYSENHSMTEDILHQIQFLFSALQPSLVRSAMDSGQVMVYWKDLPYRGQSEKKPPKVKTRARTPQEIRRNNFALGLILFMIFACTILAIHFSSPDKKQEILLLLGLGGITLLVMAGFAKGIDAWNKYLHADDLDEPEDETKQEDE